MHELLNERQEIKDADLRLFFTALLSQSHNSKILLVSRICPRFPRYQHIRSKATVDRLSEEAGIEFLRQSGVEEEETLLRQACQLTGGHPLALTLLAGLTEMMPIEDILVDKQLFWGDPDVADQLLQQFDAILTGGEQTLLGTISLLPTPATREIIIFLHDQPNTTHMLTSLLRKALLSYDRRQKVYKQHDLVRDFYRLKLEDQTKREIHLKAAEYYEQFKMEMENKMTFQEVEQRLSERYHYFQAGEYEKAAQVLVEVSEYLREWGYLERCRMLLEETLTAIEGLNPTRERQLLIVDLLVELSWVESVFESFDKALERCERAENIVKTIDDQKRAELVYHAMGRFLFEKADWENAEIYLTRSFEIGKTRRYTRCY